MKTQRKSQLINVFIGMFHGLLGGLAFAALIITVQLLFLGS